MNYFSSTIIEQNLGRVQSTESGKKGWRLPETKKDNFIILSRGTYGGKRAFTLSLFKTIHNSLENRNESPFLLSDPSKVLDL